MSFGLNTARLFARVGGVALVLGVAGCQSGGGAGALNVGNTDPKKEEPPREVISAQELTAYCPRVSLRSGTAFYNTYEKGAEGDRDKIIYQASISDVTRSCSYAGGTLTMNVAAAGKVVPGPLAKAGTITMPIRVAVVRGEEVLYSKLTPYQVQIAPNSPATQFVFNDPGVTFPAPTERNIQVFVGFDEGPPKK